MWLQAFWTVAGLDWPWFRLSANRPVSFLTERYLLNIFIRYKNKMQVVFGTYRLSSFLTPTASDSVKWRHTVRLVEISAHSVGRSVGRQTTERCQLVTVSRATKRNEHDQRAPTWALASDRRRTPSRLRLMICCAGGLATTWVAQHCRYQQQLCRYSSLTSPAV